MPPIVFPQAFFHAPNTFKPVSHIGAMNETSFAVLNFKTWFTACAHVPNPSFISISFFTIIFPFFSPNPSFISISFYHYISVHCPKTQALSLKVFTIILLYIDPKPKLYLYKFLPLDFRTLSQNPSFISKSFYHYISVHCPKIQALSL